MVKTFSSVKIKVKIRNAGVNLMSNLKKNMIEFNKKTEKKEKKEKKDFFALFSSPRA